MDQMVYNIKALKREVITWVKEKKLDLQSELLKIEEEIHVIFLKNDTGIFAKLEEELISSLETKKSRILQLEEESW